MALDIERPRDLIALLVDAATACSTSVAGFLHACESVLVFGPNPFEQLEKSASRKNIEQGLIENPSVQRWRDETGGFSWADRLDKRRPRGLEWNTNGMAGRWTAQVLERRLAGMVVRSWPKRADSEGRRPDVLHLTACLLANPEQPHTFQIARFAIVLALRALYRITLDEDCLREITRAHRELSERHRTVPDQSYGVFPFVLDVLCMGRSVHRAMTNVASINAYYTGFSKSQFGVHVGSDGRALRDFGKPGPWPTVRGTPAALPLVLNFIFNHPTGVGGLDEVLGGLRARTSPQRTWVGGGVVSLIAGPPGAGKTSLCLAIGSRMAELGSEVRYVATEEDPADLAAKRVTVVSDSYLTESFWPHAKTGLTDRFKVVEARSLRHLRNVSEGLKQSLATSDQITEAAPGEVCSTFSHVIIVDGLAALLGEDVRPNSANDEQSGVPATSRHELSSILTDLRQLGACVFLVGEGQHLNDFRLTHLVDNVFAVDFHGPELSRPQRILTIGKTRFQISHRGRHVFHISRTAGPVVSPSLTFQLSAEGRAVRDVSAQSVETGAMLCSRVASEGVPAEMVTIRGGAHTLLYGWGSSGKARLGLTLAFEPQLGTRSREWSRLCENRGDDEEKKRIDRDSMKRSRVLVISFLYNRRYYEDIARQLLQTRCGDQHQLDPKRLTVLEFYPGYLDPETFLFHIQQHIRASTLDTFGLYSAVLIDGIQNMLLQFPLFSREQLLWPALFRMLRRLSLTTVSTFTFFDFLGRDPYREGADFNEMTEFSNLPEEAQRMLHQLIVSSSDYTIKVEKMPVDKTGKSTGEAVRLLRTNTISGLQPEADILFWAPRTMRFFF